jgi:hypothetical protein
MIIIIRMAFTVCIAGLSTNFFYYSLKEKKWQIPPKHHSSTELGNNGAVQFALMSVNTTLCADDRTLAASLFSMFRAIKILGFQ